MKYFGGLYFPNNFQKIWASNFEAFNRQILFKLDSFGDCPIFLNTLFLTLEDEKMNKKISSCERKISLASCNIRITKL